MRLDCIKLDFDDVPAPQAITEEGFCDFVGTATIGGVVLDYPLESPLVRQYRPEEEVLSDEAIASYAHKPIVNSHPRDATGKRVFVTPENASQFTRGVVKRAWREGSKLRVDLRIFDAGLLADVRAGKIDLSPGYDCDTVPGAGVTPDGLHFDATQRRHRCNHVAVEYRGRNPGARLTADGQDDHMEEIKALIESGKLSPEDLAALKTLVDAKVGAPPMPTDDALPPGGAGGAGGADPMAALTTKLDALTADVAALKSKKADSLDLDPTALAKLSRQVAADAAKGLRSISEARELARPILGGLKTDGVDDPAALHRDVIATVLPDQAAQAQADYAAGKTDVLARGASMARSIHNRKLTADSADAIHGNRDPSTQAPADRDAQEKALAESLTRKSEKAS